MDQHKGIDHYMGNRGKVIKTITIIILVIILIIITTNFWTHSGRAT